MNGIRITRQQLLKLFPNDAEALRQMEILLEIVDRINNTGLDATSVINDTSTFNGILTAADINVQAALQTIDNITTSVVPEGANLYYTNARFDSRLATKTTTNLTEGANLYYTEARVNANRKNNILEYGLSSVAVSSTVTKTKTVFTGSTTGQTITLPTAGTAGREIEVFNNGTVLILISGSSTLSELYANESACFTDTGSSWIA